MTKRVFVSKTPLSGGDICQTSKVLSDQGEEFVLKELAPSLPGQFEQEAKGLKALKDSACVHVPLVIDFNEDSLLIEFIPTESPTELFWQNLGKDLSQLHKNQVSQMGFSSDNYIGRNPQKNTPHKAFRSQEDWVDFFWEYRIEEQLHLLKSRKPDPDVFARFRQSKSLIQDKLLVSDEVPCLLHGDLWSGNILCGTNQRAYLIDPAVYYGHREADLAMTQLFGGFHYSFFESYQKNYPLKPGWPQRLKIYQLYHLLNHWNLFGETYSARTLRILQELSN